MKIQNNNKRKTKASSKNNTNNSGESKNIDENVTIPPEEKDRLPKAYMEFDDDDKEPLKLPKIEAEDRLMEQDLNMEHSASAGSGKKNLISRKKYLYFLISRNFVKLNNL